MRSWRGFMPPLLFAPEGENRSGCIEDDKYIGQLGLPIYVKHDTRQPRPVCNKVVVLLLGLGGAITIFNPLRPFLGLASIVLLSVTLFLRVRVVRYGCRLPTQKMVADEER
jgi:hypothetical protein